MRRARGVVELERDAGEPVDDDGSTSVEMPPIVFEALIHRTTPDRNVLMPRVTMRLSIAQHHDQRR